MSLCIVLLVISALVACHCESPAPYSPSGWRPSGPSLSLPSEYGPPPGVLPSASFVQLSQENVQFAGQTVEVPSGPASSSAYLPPSSPARFTAKFQRIQTAPVKLKRFPYHFFLLFYLFSYFKSNRYH